MFLYQGYSFSGITLQSLPWTEDFLKRKIETKAKAVFNCVSLNKYWDGGDYIPWHIDAEKELGKNPVIASVMFGGARDYFS